MTTPTINYQTDRIIRLDTLDGAQNYAVADTIKHGDLRVFAVRADETQGPFRLLNSWTYSDGTLGFHADGPQGAVYRPPHPSTTPEDVMNATHVWDDGTYWHFAHASEDQHHEMALYCEPLVIGLFQPKINKLLVQALSADTATVRSELTDKATDLDLFADAVCNAVQVKLYAETLGHFHRNPHDGHFRQMVKDSIESVANIWKGSTNHRGKLPGIQTVLDDLDTELTTNQTVQTRAEKAAADKAKAEAEAAAAADPAPDPPAE